VIIDVDHSPRIRVKDGYDQGKRQGILLGEVVTIYGIGWAPILWDGDDDPDWFKANGLEKIIEKWESL
jgi:hypothetical protein